MSSCVSGTARSSSLSERGNASGGGFGFERTGRTFAGLTSAPALSN